MAFFENLIIVINNGISTGKDKIAIKAVFCPALEAIADIIVRIEENPALPNKSAKRYIGKS